MLPILKSRVKKYLQKCASGCVKSHLCLIFTYIFNISEISKKSYKNHFFL